MRPKKTILCVDDNEQALSVRKFLLETRGYRVISAPSAHDALEIFRSGGIDLVLSDLVMPQMDGNEMVRRMKDISPEVPMVLVSGTVKAFERANRADAFLPKGACTPVEVLERIRVMIARKRGNIVFTLGMKFRLLLHVIPDLHGRIALNARASAEHRHRERQKNCLLHPTTTSTVPAPTLFRCSAVIWGLKIGSSASTTRMNRSSVARCAI